MLIDEKGMESYYKTGASFQTDVAVSHSLWIKPYYE